MTKMTKVQAMDIAVQVMTGEVSADINPEIIANAVGKLNDMIIRENARAATATAKRKEKIAEKATQSAEVLADYIASEGAFTNLTSAKFAEAIGVTTPKASAILRAGFNSGVLTRKKAKSKSPYTYSVVVAD